VDGEVFDGEPHIDGCLVRNSIGHDAS
jgi:hypothetical protein